MQLDLGLDLLIDRLKIREQDNKPMIHDCVRERWLVLQPEEMVRQLVVHYLIACKGYSRHRISLERGIMVNGLYKRFDLLVYDSQVQPFMLIECKSPQVSLTEATFRQIAAYNQVFQVPYLFVTNGRDSYCCQMNYSEALFTFVAEIPDYPG